MINQGKIWVVSEVYYPDEQGGGHFMTKLAEGLAQFYNVKVLCGYPYYHNDNVSIPKKEIKNDVHIEHCFETRLNKNILLLRLINIISVSISIFFKSLLRIRKQDLVIVVTTPPSLPFIIAIVCWLVRAKCIIRIEDVYPEILIATGFLKPDAILARFLSSLNCFLYKRVDGIAVLGRDMERLVMKKLAYKKYKQNVAIIPNWADLDLVAPLPKKDNVLLHELGLLNKFIVQCAGNMGSAQGIEDIFRAADLLKNDENIHFLFIGTGSKRPWMEKEVRKKNLTNVTTLDQRARADQPNFLNACDIAIVSLIPGMKGTAMPSRLYNIMAAGKPIIAVAEFDSELSLTVEKEKIGWTVLPNEPGNLADKILKARSHPDQLLEMGQRACEVAHEKYSHDIGIKSYCRLIESLN